MSRMYVDIIQNSSKAPTAFQALPQCLTFSVLDKEKSGHTICGAFIQKPLETQTIKDRKKNNEKIHYHIGQSNSIMRNGQCNVKSCFDCRFIPTGEASTSISRLKLSYGSVPFFT